ncbi:MAG: hypothetical protein ACX93T_04390, partial [Bacteroidota bacterium]
DLVKDTVQQAHISREDRQEPQSGSQSSATPLAGTRNIEVEEDCKMPARPSALTKPEAPTTEIPFRLNACRRTLAWGKHTKIWVMARTYLEMG